MLPRTITPAVACVAGAAFAFWSYSVTRTMCETVGFKFGPFVGGLVIASVVPLTLVTPLALRVRQSPMADPTSAVVLRSIAALVMGLLVGSMLSEGAILVDETRFENEVAGRGHDAIYARARAWPNEMSSLVFVPGDGIHSTD